MFKNYYEILGVSISSTQNEIKKAYREKAIKYHPDKHFGDKFFSEKFIEINEGYQILSDLEKKTEYDNLYKKNFVSKENTQQKDDENIKNNKEIFEDEFQYNPYKPFYSSKDRLNNDTPQFDPIINHWGGKVKDDIDFFKLPKKIGKIISGFSTLKKNISPPSKSQIFFRYFKIYGISLLISIAIVTIIISNDLDPFWIIIWGVIPIIIAIWYSKQTDNFKHICTYIGVNGFAIFECLDKRENIISSVEINFNEVTDLISAIEIRKMNFSYSDTSYSYIWLNKGQKVHVTNGLHYSEKGDPERFFYDYWVNHYAERYWTVYLLDKMETELEKKGFLEFNLGGAIPYIQIGVGFIKFLSEEKGQVTYNFNEIKRAYIKGTNLFIEHQNYDKKFIFFESGNKNGIPLLYLSNRLFFFRAMELLLGLKFSQK